MIGVPKNVGRLDADERLAAKVARLAERKRQRKPLKRSWIKPGAKGLARRTALRARNPERLARRAAHYRAVLASPFHRELRYRCFQRAQGLCECGVCVAWRADLRPTDEKRLLFPDAFQPTPAWFTNGGRTAWRRFRSDAGQMHHDSYALFGQENREELRLVRWMWKEHHAAIERLHGTRRRYLRGTSGEPRCRS